MRNNVKPQMEPIEEEKHQKKPTVKNMAKISQFEAPHPYQPNV